jgi:hypothetical protein
MVSEAGCLLRAYPVLQQRRQARVRGLIGVHSSGHDPAENVVLSSAPRALSPPLALVAADQSPLTLTSSFASERSAPFDRTTYCPAIWTAGRPHRGDRSTCASQIAPGPRPKKPANVRLPKKSFGIIPDVVRWRKCVGTTAVKSPEQMRDVAQIRCDQTGVIKVDDPAGT